MLKAHKRGVRKRIAVSVIHLRLRQFFAGVHVRGDLVALANDDKPTLYFANHISFWDAQLASYLTYTQLRQDPFIMTLESSMLPITSWGGAFGVDNLSPFNAAKSLRYATRLLKDVPRCGLWIFPQGMIFPFHRRPLGFRFGTAAIINQVKDVRLVPVVFYYAFTHYLKPEAFISFGEPFKLASDLNASELTDELEKHIIHELKQLCTDLSNCDTETFKTIVQGKHDTMYYLSQLTGKPRLPPLKTWGFDGL